MGTMPECHKCGVCQTCGRKFDWIPERRVYSPKTGGLASEALVHKHTCDECDDIQSQEEYALSISREAREDTWSR